MSNSLEMKRCTFLLFLILFPLVKTVAQQIIPKVDIKEYEQIKNNGAFSKTNGEIPAGGFVPNLDNLKKLASTHHLRGKRAMSLCSCYVPADASYTLAIEPNDDGSDTLLSIPFTFCLYGTNYTSLYINNNGNVSFGSSYTTFSSNPFPDPTFVMVAPFWADVDTRNPGSGLVYYKITPTYAIIKWDGVARYDSTSDLLNTFQVIITDGNDPVLPFGNNISFCYGDMQWTTGYGGTAGFGGSGATVGVNKGDGIASIQIGQFNAPGIAYDGSFGNYDGVDFLDKQSFYSNFCVGTNMAPVASGLSNCDTIKMCGTGDTLYLKEEFLAPEAGQNTTVSVNLNGTPNATVISNVSGNSAYAIVRIIATAANAGVHTITFIGTDNGIPVGSTIINSNIFVDTSSVTALNPHISGTTQFCQGDSSVLSVTPTTYDNYVWSTVSSGLSTTVNASGMYFVTATLNGCSKSASTQVTVHPAATPSISGFPFTCSGSGNVTMLYSDSLIYNSYLWSNTNTNDTIYTGTGIYYLTVINAFGCTGSDTITVTPIAGNVMTTLAGNTITANFSGAMYQWINCSAGNTPIPGETNQSYTAVASGNYAVIVTNGVCTDTSACTAIVVTGIHENNFNNTVTIAPNPFTYQTVITFGEEQKNCTVKILDVLGKEIFSKVFEERKKQIIIDKGEMTKGIYFIQLIMENKSVMNKKIIVQ